MRDPRAKPPLGFVVRQEIRRHRKPGCFQLLPPLLRLPFRRPSAMCPPPWPVLSNRPYVQWSPGPLHSGHVERPVPVLQRALDKKKRLFSGAKKRTLLSREKPLLSGFSLAL